MADPTDGSRRDDRTSEPSGDGQVEDRLQELGARLDKVQSRRDTGQAARRDRSALALGLRIASELVASILVGGLIGWQLDKWLGTTPFLLIIFFLLGTAAGLRSVMRAASTLSTTASTSAQDDPNSGRGPDNA